MESKCCKNTDKELWRRIPGDFYSPSVHVTEGGGIGMDVGGYVIVASVEMWHRCGKLMFCVNPDKPSWMRQLALWLLEKDVIKIKPL